MLPVTHDYLSSVLGLRRAGVTETLIRFEELGLIRKMRGVLQIGERESLEQRACSCYKLIANAYNASEGSGKIEDATLDSERALWCGMVQSRTASDL
ncbi:helix-turn-helix domain-containing protein [Bradyrhizobium sp. CCBAU 11445]|uniref:helix-turn-helix domain-containing protein n=1 Tax=Bradyrhizobium sp. CCBAU 11445 TaxID=1630896 RepID=UPI0023055B09|nr:helix-turn-helix domain-containing protein [Bradyrhizobium sp. CCBAU 11445]